MTIAFTAGEGRSLVQLNVPLEPFRELSRAVKSGAPPAEKPPEPAPDKPEKKAQPEKKAKDR